MAFDLIDSDKMFPRWVELYKIRVNGERVHAPECERVRLIKHRKANCRWSSRVQPLELACYVPCINASLKYYTVQ